MYKLIYVLILCNLFSKTFGQTQLTKVCQFGKEIEESSGIEIGNDNTYWTHNDSGDKPCIYQLNKEGRILRKVLIKNALGIDIEDLAKEDGKFLYVGDFGNNKNDRRNLVIYKIKWEDLNTKDSVIGQEIKFVYPDQKFFPPEKSQRNFDCEAFFWMNHHLYLFSKSRGNSHYTKLYQLPDKKGNYTAKLMDSFPTGRFVTSADISPSQKKMTLLCESSLYIFKEFEKDNFFKGNFQKITLNATQKEAIVFEDETLLVMTDERNSKRDGFIYSLSIKDEKTFHPLQDRFSIDPSPQDNKLYFSYNEIEKKNYKIEIRNVDMNKNMEKEEKEISPNHSQKVDLKLYEDGNYTISFTEVGGSYFLKLPFSVKHE